MKNVLMILFLLGGFVMQTLEAQNCSLPCPPGCCKISCPLGANRGSASAEKTGEVTLASLMVDGKEPMCTMSRKEMKACMAACQFSGQQAPNDNMHTADASYFHSFGQQASASTPASQPACHVTASCKAAPSIASTATPIVQQVRVKEKS